MRSLDDLNYYSDSRVISALTKRVITGANSRRNLVTLNLDTIAYFSDRVTLTAALIDAVERARVDACAEERDSLGEAVISLPCRNALCEQCNGDGKVVNPSVDAGGLDLSDADDDFIDRLMSGAFDLTCPACKGARVTAQVDEGALTGADRLTYRALMALEDAADDEARTEARERMMGY